jgi:hypothetical protein
MEGSTRGVADGLSERSFEKRTEDRDCICAPRLRLEFSVSRRHSGGLGVQKAGGSTCFFYAKTSSPWPEAWRYRASVCVRELMLISLGTQRSLVSSTIPHDISTLVSREIGLRHIIHYHIIGSQDSTSSVSVASPCRIYKPFHVYISRGVRLRLPRNEQRMLAASEVSLFG